ncbi:hypothetical protein KEJ34_04900 [Candidatus Bathyarchaeota archaeon]|nr:hypothetical protein [Candidatus Bathyarchaeota archaeon]
MSKGAFSFLFILGFILFIVGLAFHYWLLGLAAFSFLLMVAAVGGALYFGVIRAEEVMENWSILIEDGRGRGNEVLDGTLRFLRDAEVQNVSVEKRMEIIYPELRRATENFHKRGVPVLLHCDGNINLLMNGIIEAGIDAVQPLEPTAGMKLRDVKAKYGEEICLIRNIDVAYTLTSGTAGQVIREVKKAINEAAYGGDTY